MGAAPDGRGSLPGDPEALEAWLSAHVPGWRGPARAERLAGGQSNPTYRLTGADGPRLVLRRRPDGPLLPSAHAVDREHRAMSALGAAGFPVPRTFGLCEDPSVAGTPFFVMEFVEGRIFFDPRLPSIAPAERRALFDAMGETAARLHGIDPAAIGLADYGRAGGYLVRQVARWTKQYRVSETVRIEAMDRLIDWLPQNVPPGDETAVVHGDLRMDNLVFHPTEPRVAAVLDWELSTLGHPLADFAYNCMAWRLEPELFRGLKGADLGALGIPTEAAYAEAYRARTGRGEIPHWEFFQAFNMFRLAAILQGIAKRAADGTAVGADARETGAKAGPVAEAGWRAAQAAGA